MTSTQKKYTKIRQHTLDICSPLEIEDYVVQPTPDVSPPKWHLGHTTWFFEEMVLVKFLPEYRRFNDQFGQLFNSYYKAAGTHWAQAERGHLSRPTVKEIFTYRDYIDSKMTEFLTQFKLSKDCQFVIETGLHHEQQHQELLLMDIKYIFNANPLLPTYKTTPLKISLPKNDGWTSFKKGLYKIGFDDTGFAYDNEMPTHNTFLHPFSISNDVVTNRDYLKFIEDNGYQTPLLWLSNGWDWVNQNKITAPLYWQKKDGEWVEFTLHGLHPLDLDAPVTHISYFEADAYANWEGIFDFL